MSRARSIIGRLSLAGAITFSVGMLGASCGGGGDASSGPKEPVEIAFDGESDLFPSLSYSTGLQPKDSPVQASFTITAKGSQKVHAAALPSGPESAPTLTGLPGKGSLALDGGFFLIGKLKINIQGVPPYDGPIPGLDNMQIPIKGESAFDPFSIEKPVKVHADVPPSKLPGIPLPGGIPGELVIEIAEGSTVDLTFTGKCAGVDGATATYEGQIDRGGKLVIKPSVEITVPLVGKKSFAVPAFSVDLALGANTLEMSAPIKQFGTKPSQGDHVTGSCKGSGSGGSATSAASTSATGTGGAGATGAGGAGGGTATACMSNNDCGGLPCLDGACSPGGGICQTGLTFGDGTVDTCISNHCCQEFLACEDNGKQACNDCLANGGGPVCDAFLLCAGPCAGQICDSGIAVGGASYTDAQCLSTKCCVEFNACTMNGAQPQACSDCFQSGGGPGTVCEAALDCAKSSCGF